MNRFIVLYDVHLFIGLYEAQDFVDEATCVAARTVAMENLRRPVEDYTNAAFDTMAEAVDDTTLDALEDWNQAPASAGQRGDHGHR